MGSAKRQIEAHWEEPVNNTRNGADVRERAEKYLARIDKAIADNKENAPDLANLFTEGPIIRDLLALLAEKDKVIEQVLQAFDGIEPEDWNDGCGCCAAENLDRSDEWKALSEAALAAREQAEGGG